MARNHRSFARTRSLVFAVLILVVGMSATLILRNFTIDNSVSIWFATDDPALVTYERHLETFGHTEWTLLMVETASVHDPAFQRDLRRLTSALEGLQHVQRVLSIVNAPGSAGRTTAGVRRPEPKASARGLLLRPGDDRRTVLLLQTDNHLRRQDPYRMALVDRIHAAVERIPSITAHSLAGTSVINAELNRSARRDMFVFFTLVTLLVFGISLALFRSLRDAAVLLTVAGATVIFTMGLLAVFGYSLNMVTLMLPTVLIAMSVADAIHVIQTFHIERATAGAKQAVARTIRRVCLPCLGTTVTTIVGFLSLAGSSVLPIFQLAIFGACGIAMALLLSLTVAPLMLYQLWRRDALTAQRSRHGHPRYVETLLGWLKHRPGTILMAFAVASGGLAGLCMLEADTNYAEFFRAGSAVPRDYARIDAAGFGQNPLVLTLKVPAAAQGRGAVIAASLARFDRRLRRLPEVTHVLSPNADAPNALGLLSADGRQRQVIVMTRYLSSRELHGLTDRVRRLKRAILPDATVLTITGTTVLWARMDTQIIRTQISSALIVSVALLIVLTLLFRSPTLALIGWLVSVFPVALILGVMGFFGVRINMATVLIAGIALGIAVDDTIHLIFAFRERLRAGNAPRLAVERALREIAPRLVITSAILIGGFGSMVASSFLPTAYFGLFSCLTIAIALLCDLLVLPLALRVWGESWLRHGARLAPRRSAQGVTALAVDPRRC